MTTSRFFIMLILLAAVAILTVLIILAVSYLILFGGDRLACCDEAVIARNTKGQVVGLATLAPEGELGEGPAIVGLYVLPAYRRQGIGTALTAKAVERMGQRQLGPVRVDLISTAAARLIKNTPRELRNQLVVRWLGPILDLLSPSMAEDSSEEVSL